MESWDVREETNLVWWVWSHPVTTATVKDCRMRRGHLFSARRWRWALLYNLWGTTCKIFQKSGSPINVFSIYSYSPATSNGNKLLAILRFCRVRDNAAFITLLWFVIRPRQSGSEHLITVSSIHTFQMKPFLCWAMNRAWKTVHEDVTFKNLLRRNAKQPLKTVSRREFGLLCDAKQPP